MKTLSLVMTMTFVLLVGDQFCNFGGVCSADTLSLEPNESSMLAYLREEQKFLRDCHLGVADQYKQSMYIEPADDAQLNMAKVKTLLNYYGVEDPVTDETPWSAYSTDSTFWTEELDWMSYTIGWGMMPYILNFSAYIEEMSIRDLWQAIEGTDEKLLDTAYNEILQDSYDHLRLFATAIVDDPKMPSYYQAQILSQEDVDAILAGTIPSVVGFSINAGLNDAWYNPETSGQGFFITVFPDLGSVSLAWFTYDTELPPADAHANLGDPGHRWLTAVGPIMSNQVLMNIEMTSGGLFDTPTTIQRTDPPGSDGTIVLTFTSCNSGTFEYDIPSINRQGTVPIQRVADDNIALCEALNSN